jgi:hypothetical protein
MENFHKYRKRNEWAKIKTIVPFHSFFRTSAHKSESIPLA